MSVIMKRNLHLLKILVHSSSHQRRAVLQEASDDLIKFTEEIALNTLKGNIPLTTSQLKNIKKQRIVIKALCNKRHSIERKKKTVNQKDGFIGSLIRIALPFLSGLFTAPQS